MTGYIAKRRNGKVLLETRNGRTVASGIALDARGVDIEMNAGGDGVHVDGDSHHVDGAGVVHVEGAGSGDAGGLGFGGGF